MKKGLILLLTLLLASMASANPIDLSKPMPLPEPWIQVLETPSSAVPMMLAVAVVLETIAASLYTTWRKKRVTKRLLLSVAAANIVSVPLFYFSLMTATWSLFPQHLSAAHLSLMPVAIIVIVISTPFEFFVVFLEAAIIKLLSRKELTYLDAVGLTFVANLFSFVVGSLFLLVF